MKVKLNSINSDSKLFFSYEWLPSINNEDLDCLVKRIHECSTEFEPLFCAVPWHNISSSKEETLLKFAKCLQNHNQQVMFHMCCQSLGKDDILRILLELKANGIRNIFALRGDSKEYRHEGSFKYAKDLVQFIRSEFGSYFTVCVAGYPSGHPCKLSKSDELKYLKEKVDAGADFIISQIVFDANEFIQFVKDCRSIGIHVPIIPGIFPVQNFDLVQRITKKCGVSMPHSIKQKYIELRDDPEEFENFAIQTTVNMITSIIRSGVEVFGVHFFTMNRAPLRARLKRIGKSPCLTSVLKPKD